MALVTIVGYPCSGKSTIAAKLNEYFQQRLAAEDYRGPKLEVVLVSDESSHVSRSVYDDSKVEKSGRANLFSNLTRSLSPHHLVICDSLNYIKGFRYQMYCAAKEAHSRICTVHVLAPPEKCREWHEKRGECSYKPATYVPPPYFTYARFDNLIMRFEEPSSMVRWDSPLFTIPWDEEPPYSAIWESITTGAKAPPTAAVAVVPQPPANTLQILTNTTSTIVSALLANPSPGGTFQVPSPPASDALTLHLPLRTITLSELQRLKRQFERVHTLAVQSNGRAAGTWTEGEVAAKFISFLEITWDT